MSGTLRLVPTRAVVAKSSAVSHATVSARDWVPHTPSFVGVMEQVYGGVRKLGLASAPGA
jgi:hypothetical protein